MERHVQPNYQFVVICKQNISYLCTDHLVNSSLTSLGLRNEVNYLYNVLR